MLEGPACRNAAAAHAPAGVARRAHAWPSRTLCCAACWCTRNRLPHPSCRLALQDQNAVLQQQLQEACAGWQAAESALRDLFTEQQQHLQQQTQEPRHPLAAASTAAAPTVPQQQQQGPISGCAACEAVRAEGEAFTRQLVACTVELAHVKEAEQEARHEVRLLQGLINEMIQVGGGSAPRREAVVGPAAAVV